MPVLSVFNPVLFRLTIFSVKVSVVVISIIVSVSVSVRFQGVLRVMLQTHSKIVSIISYRYIIQQMLSAKPLPITGFKRYSLLW